MVTSTLEHNVKQNPQIELKDQVAFVTGAGSGIGRAAAIRLAQAGAKVALVDLKEGRAEEVKKQIQDFDGEAIVCDTDLSNVNRVEEAIQQTAKQWGRIDIVFANAGINGTVAPIEDLTLEQWEHTLSTNLTGTFLTLKCALPYMKQQGGSVIFTSSINGNRKYSGFGMSAYSVSKAGQVALMKMAALELARYRIRVNAICPGAIQTHIGENTFKSPELDKIKIPVKYPEGSQPLEHGPGSPEQVADLVAFLASPLSSHITGTEIYIDGAESLL
ncbi:SDR family oxidoreductase [Marinicrinis lubricantis]|uniref:SDR family oxidoreductase n=1 Tax=Marinicrinis lubricantis TaxID=2086470 RepID=A0ABW1IKX6_9BACL